MLMVISPAKSLDFTAPDQVLPLTTPELKPQIAELAKVTRKLTVADLRRLMHISEKLAELNRERFQHFDAAVEEGLQAVIAFNGDVYAGLNARTGPSGPGLGPGPPAGVLYGRAAAAGRPAGRSPGDGHAAEDTRAQPLRLLGETTSPRP